MRIAVLGNLKIKDNINELNLISDFKTADIST